MKYFNLGNNISNIFNNIFQPGQLQGIEDQFRRLRTVTGELFHFMVQLVIFQPGLNI